MPRRNVQFSLTKRFRNVCFTIFPEGEEGCIPPHWDSTTMSYIVYGWELCPDSGRPHWQCYAEFKSQITGRQLQRLYPRAHFEAREGSARAASDYCKEDGDWEEHGTISNQGERRDLHTAASEVAEGGAMGLATLVASNPGLFVQYHNGFTRLAALTESTRQRRWTDVKCEILWGATNCGKTRYWFDKYWPDCYRFTYQSHGGLNWDGYRGQKHVAFDEFKCQIPMSVMLQWTDGYPMELNIKYGSTYKQWETVTFMSNDPPQSWYSGCSTETRKAFARRISQVTHFVEGREPVTTQGFKFNESVIFISGDADV